jgi:signal transduction histidine kinase
MTVATTPPVMTPARRTTAETRSDANRGWRSSLPTDRLRIVGWFMALLVAAGGLTTLAVRQILLERLDEEIEDGLRQEVEEVRSLASGNDPDTGEPFGNDVAAIFDTFLRRNIPGEGEALFTVVDGRAYRASFSPPHRLDAEPELIRRWAGLAQTRSGEVDSPAGPARWLAIPLRDGDRTLGTFVVANFVQQERNEVDEAVRVVILVSAGVLLAGVALAWLAAGRVLAPVRTLTDTARAITAETGLERRIEVSGSGELAEVATTVNEMLDRLEAAFRTQLDFVNDAGHELRTPLTIVRGQLQTLDDDPAERAETMALVDDELNRMGRIVDDLLLLAKAERPGFLELDLLDLEVFTVELHAKAEALGPRRWLIDAVGNTTMRADRDRLTQAMVNLAANAVHHTPPDAEIGIGSSVEDGDARLWVRDTGIGVSSGDEDRIFDRFARGEHQRARSEGAGLGLAIARAVAEAHDGRVELINRPGQGATFAMVVPVQGPRP